MAESAPDRDGLADRALMRVRAGPVTVEISRQAPPAWDVEILRSGSRVPTVLATTWWAEYLQQAVFARPWYLRAVDSNGMPLALLLAFSEYPMGRATFAWRSARWVAALGRGAGV